MDSYIDLNLIFRIGKYVREQQGMLGPQHHGYLSKFRSYATIGSQAEEIEAHVTSFFAS